MRENEHFYSICRDCTAKWFSPKRLRTCPRCGSDEVMHTLARPPWQSEGADSAIRIDGNRKEVRLHFLQESQRLR